VGLNAAADQLQIAREFAVLGDYDTARVYYQGVLSQLARSAPVRRIGRVGALGTRRAHQYLLASALSSFRHRVASRRFAQLPLPHRFPPAATTAAAPGPLRRATRISPPPPLHPPPSPNRPWRVRSSVTRHHATRPTDPNTPPPPDTRRHVTAIGSDGAGAAGAARTGRWLGAGAYTRPLSGLT
jgi:hypothetical protein